MTAPVEHNTRLCPMCGGPLTSTVKPLGSGNAIRVTVTCHCPDVQHELTYPTPDDEGEAMRRRVQTCKSHVRDRAIFRDGFDAAMRVVHRFAETHLPTVEKGAGA